MLGPNRTHLFVGREFTTVGGSPGAGNRLALFGRKHNRPRKVGTCKLHDSTGNIILIRRRQTTHDFYCFIEELCHGASIKFGGAEVE